MAHKVQMNELWAQAKATIWKLFLTEEELQVMGNLESKEQAVKAIHREYSMRLFSISDISKYKVF